MCRCATPTDQECERAQDHHLGRRASVSESYRALYGKKPGAGQAFARPSPGSTRPSSCSWCEERRVCRGAKQITSRPLVTIDALAERLGELAERCQQLLKGGEVERLGAVGLGAVGVGV